MTPREKLLADLQRIGGPPKEHDEQVRFVNWLRRAYPRVRFFAIPNGGHRNLIVAKRLKDEGVDAGVPDIFIPAWKLWVEMKRSKGSKTKASQKAWKAYLEGCGYTVLQCKGYEAARAEVVLYRARAGAALEG